MSSKTYFWKVREELDTVVPFYFLLNFPKQKFLPFYKLKDFKSNFNKELTNYID